MKLSKILKDSNYHLSLFKNKNIEDLENRIEEKKGFLVRNK